MTQDQAIQRGFTEFIEVWREKGDKEGENVERKHNINTFDDILAITRSYDNIYTVAIFLIKPKQ